MLIKLAYFLIKRETYYNLIVYIILPGVLHFVTISCFRVELISLRVNAVCGLVFSKALSTSPYSTVIKVMHMHDTVSDQTYQPLSN